MRNKLFMLQKSPAIKLDDYRIVYIPIPKVACTSIRSVCVDLLDFELPENAWKPSVLLSKEMDKYIDVKKRDASLITALQAYRLTGFWKFAITRNPYDRLVSCYSEKVCKNIEMAGFVNGVSKGFVRYKRFYGNMPFKEYVEAVCDIPDSDADPHFRSQHTFITSPKDEVYVDFLCDFEDLELLTNELRSRTGRDVSIPHMLKSNRSAWENYYTEEIRAMVAKRYKMDFELFGYKA